MTLMYYAKDDTEEKFGWDLDSKVAPKVPRCVSRKYTKEWTKLGTNARKLRVEDYFAYKTDPDFKGGEEAHGREQDLAGTIPSGSQKKCKGVTFAEDEPTLGEVVGVVKAVAGTGKQMAEEVDELGNKQRKLEGTLRDLYDAMDGVAERVTTLVGSHTALSEAHNDLSKAHNALEVKVDNESSRIDDLEKKLDSVLSGVVTAPTKGDLSGKGRSRKWRTTHTIPEEEEFAQTQ